MNAVNRDEAALLLDCGIDIQAINKVVDCSHYSYLNTHKIINLFIWKNQQNALIGNANHFHVTKMLVERGVDIHHTDCYGNNVLMHAVDVGNDLVVQYLLQETKINVNVQNKVSRFLSLTIVMFPEKLTQCLLGIANCIDIRILASTR